MGNGGDFFMRLRIFGLLILCITVGCESISTQHQTLEGTEPSTSPARLMSLSNLNDGQPPVLRDRMMTPEEEGVASSVSYQEAVEPENFQEKKPVDPFPTVYFPFDSWGNQLSSSGTVRCDCSLDGKISELRTDD